MPYLAFTRESKQKQWPQDTRNESTTSLEEVIGAQYTTIPPALQRLFDYYHHDDQRRGALQVPQTLDQFHYQSLLVSDRKTKDQVLYRHQQRGEDPDADPFICLVDQLWLHVVDDATIVTSTSQHLDDDILDLTTATTELYKSDNYKSVRKDSVYGLIPLILATCIRKSMEKELGGKKERVLDMFAAAVTNTSKRQVALFNDFRKNISNSSQSHDTGDTDVTRVLTEEIDLLQEVNDVLIELNIIKTVLGHQKDILESYSNFVDAEIDRGNGFYNDSKGAKVIIDTVVTCKALSRIDVYIGEVEKMVFVAKETQNNLHTHLDLRQRDANLNEAVWARKAAQETTQQSRTIMVFTVVTIFFLPITFLSSLFALDITVFPHDDEGDLKYGPGWAFSWLFGMTIAVSLPLVLLAFYVNEVALLWKKWMARWQKDQNRGVGVNERVGFFPITRIMNSRLRFRTKGSRKMDRAEGTGAKEVV
ncbi:hypothetical protein PFICI_06093 [Pestalotiopsis fici W106-1]|uniref:Uncharacterized protein n=1 Tax=Pestalotiopsis fici (strain W106-1 / CGMCC3.15140) TaxID=1229662 RepID=W3X7E3_PESFW|nr:uncharacterized protein PFICI_06093 [Pestalotiopsis fici W106-1]ETS81091.1 hypothetical protein PFICI_06093 [Pestalotiopsis fici W106-1]